MLPTIQDTILQQIRATDKWALAAWGARDFKASNKSLYMRVNGTKFKRGWIEVELMANDTYTVRAIQIYKADRKIKAELEGVYDDNLVIIINSIVG